MSFYDSTLPRILCVDDRASSLEVRRALLTQAGYEALTASDPPAAMAIFNQTEIDLVILDYSFPCHISGEELAHQLRARNPKLPLIMLSGVPDLPDSAAASVDVLILKGGGRPTDLLDAVAALLRGAKPATEPLAGEKEPRGAEIPRANAAHSASGDSQD